MTRANQSAAAGAPAGARAAFANLPADRQDEFLAALEDDVRDPSEWGSGEEVEYVRHEATWYRVEVVIEN